MNVTQSADVTFFLQAAKQQESRHTWDANTSCLIRPQPTVYLAQSQAQEDARCTRSCNVSCHLASMWLDKAVACSTLGFEGCTACLHSQSKTPAACSPYAGLLVWVCGCCLPHVDLSAAGRQAGRQITARRLNVSIFLQPVYSKAPH
jgi:hypothetical protein